MRIEGCVYCKNNKDRKIQFKRLKSELAAKPECTIWYEKNLLMYSYQSTRKELFTI